MGMDSPYSEMPFVRYEGDRFLSWWSPPVVHDAGGSESAYDAEWAIGKHFAATMIESLRQAAKIRLDSDGLANVVEEIVKRGTLGNIERGFLCAISQYIAEGRFTLTGDFDGTLYNQGGGGKRR